MLVPDLNIFFVHVPKCAGVSIELIFFERDGLKLKPHHIVKQLTPEQRAKYKHGDYLSNDPNIKLNGPAQHFTASQAKQYVEQYGDCYTFTIVRNPWDKMVSEFQWQKQILRRNVTLKRVIQEAEVDQSKRRDANPHYMPQWMFVYDDDNNKLVDDVFFIEDMQSVQDMLNSKFDLGVTLTKSNSTKRNHYSDYYTDDLRDKVQAMYSKDIELFNYSYEQQ
jgi:hypothetical protein